MNIDRPLGANNKHIMKTRCFEAQARYENERLQTQGCTSVCTPLRRTQHQNPKLDEAAIQI